MHLPARSVAALVCAVLLSASANAAGNPFKQNSPASVTKQKEAVNDEPTKATKSEPATVNSSYTIRAGDSLHVSVWKEDEMDRIALVLPDGNIDFPLIGSVQAAGLTPAELKDVITKKLAPFIPAATVSVVVKETLGNIVSVIGQVAHPGDFVMNRPISIMQALSLAGGPTPYADDDDIVILRKSADGKQASLPFDYSAVSRGNHLEDNITLQPGDVVIVPTASLF